MSWVPQADECQAADTWVLAAVPLQPSHGMAPRLGPSGLALSCQTKLD